MKKTMTIVFAFAMVFAASAQLQPATGISTVSGRGRNADYRTAVFEALVQAVSQVQGVSLQDSRDAFMDSVKQLKSTKQEESSIDELRESLKQNVSARTKGRVLGYEITSEKYDQAMGMWFVALNAKVPGRYSVGTPADNRRRMIIMPFKSLTGTVNVFGKTIQLSTTSESIAAALNENLVQTRRFTMLDRAFDADTQAELGRLNLENASAGDFGRFQQLLVTDYMVIGTVKMYPSPASSYNQWTGKTTVNDGPFLEISYRVILVPTTQLEWAGTVIVPYSSCRGDSVETAIASGVSVAAQEICHDIVNNMHPLRVTAKTSMELVLNQGGKNVRIGEVFDVFRRGTPVVDVDTGETLGAPEEKIAVIQITRVDPKMSYAVVVEGTPLAQIPVGAVVRRPAAIPSAPPPVGAVSPVQVNQNGTVTPQWKK